QKFPVKDDYSQLRKAPQSLPLVHHDGMRQAFEERLNTIYPLLAEVPGFEVVKPQGAFYLFPNVKKAMEMKGYTDVTDFTTAILEEAEVALVTGAGFGAPENVRLSYATDLDTLKEAVERLKAFMGSEND
ncbi:aminotransferase class I/II-fold pyridoxal phosphate-dependent enzyme, partial [Burkholderia cenocepacia]|nr:aminotransferase class I/II-fold pyridoxal phosphate-dependent enzyme [Burkholderia cenocepacia]